MVRHAAVGCVILLLSRLVGAHEDLGEDAPPARRPWHPHLAWRRLEDGGYGLDRVESAGADLKGGFVGEDTSRPLALVQTGATSKTAASRRPCNCQNGDEEPKDVADRAGGATSEAAGAEGLSLASVSTGTEVQRRAGSEAAQPGDLAMPRQQQPQQGQQQPLLSPAQQQWSRQYGEQGLSNMATLPAFQQQQQQWLTAQQMQLASQEQWAQQQQQQQWANQPVQAQAPLAQQQLYEQQSASPQAVYPAGGYQQQPYEPQAQLAGSPLWQQEVLMQQQQQQQVPMQLQMQMPAPPQVGPPQQQPVMLRGYMMVQQKAPANAMQSPPMAYRGQGPLVLGEMPAVAGVAPGWQWSAVPPPQASMFPPGRMQVAQAPPPQQQQQGYAYR